MSSIRSVALDRDARRVLRVRRDPEHAREVVAAAAGQDRERARARRPATPASGRRKPSPPSAATVSPACDRRARLLAGVLDALGLDRPVRGAEPVELGRDRRQAPQRAAAARRGVDEQREAPRHSRAAAAAIRAARSAAKAPRSAPRSSAPSSNLRMSARATSSSPSRRSACGSSRSLGVERQQHVLLDGVPRLVGHPLRGHEQLAGPGQPVELEDAEPVGVQPLAVREEEVDAAEGRARRIAPRPSGAATPRASAGSKSRISRLKMCSESVSPARRAHAGLAQAR